MARNGQKLIPFKEMRAYISKTITSATRKLKRWEKSGWYKGSEIMQIARKNLRMLYKKYGYESDKYHTGKIFQSKLTSYEDLKLLYNTILSIQSANSKEAIAKMKENEAIFERIKKTWQKLGVKVSNISYDEAFDSLSLLSEEFHEIFAFMTYNEVKIALAENSDIVNVFDRYMSRIEDKILTDKQEHYREKLEEKISKSARLSATDVQYLYRDKFKF